MKHKTTFHFKPELFKHSYKFNKIIYHIWTCSNYYSDAFFKISQRDLNIVLDSISYVICSSSPCEAKGISSADNIISTNQGKGCWTEKKAKCNFKFMYSLASQEIKFNTTRTRHVFNSSYHSGKWHLNEYCTKIPLFCYSFKTAK